VTAFLLYAYLARVLGPTLFGEWTVVLSILSWLEILVAAGLVKVATKAISENPDSTPRFARAVYAGQIAISVTVAAVVAFAADPIAGVLGNPALAPLIRVAVLDVPLYAVFMAASAVVLGRQRYFRQGVAWIVYASAKAGLIAGFVYAGMGIQGALVGNALSSLVGLMAIYTVVGGSREPLAKLVPSVRWMAAAAVPFVVLSLVQGVAQYADLWIVSARVEESAAVGLYAAATVLAEIPVFLFLGLQRVIFPSISSARASGDTKRADEYAVQSVRAAVLVSVLAVAFVAAAGRQVIELVFSATFVAAYLPVVMLMVAGAGRTIYGTCAEILMARDSRKAAMSLVGATVVLEVVTVACAANTFGIRGAAIATAVSMSAGAVAAVVVLRATVARRALATLVRAVLAAAVVGFALYAIGPSVAGAVIAVPFVAAAYVGLLWLLREFDARDVSSIRDVIGGG
jgi:O-antigen/teichoic acid export membrane protein